MTTAGRVQEVRRSEWVDRLAAAGLVAFGVVHLVLAWLMVTLALGEREGAATSKGAMRELAEKPFGGVLVWVVALGMLLLAAWQALEAVAGHHHEDDTTRLRKRLTSAGKAVAYAVIGASGITVATGSGSSGGTDSWTARLMDLPGGQVLVGLVGIGVAGVGVALLVMAWRESYLHHLDGEGRSGDSGTTYRWLGRVGHVAKGLALLAVGALFGYAAATHEAERSGGLDDALRELLGAPGGPFLVGAIGVGFGAYGVFCFAWARHLDR